MGIISLSHCLNLSDMTLDLKNGNFKYRYPCMLYIYETKYYKKTLQKSAGQLIVSAYTWSIWIILFVCYNIILICFNGIKENVL